MRLRMLASYHWPLCAWPPKRRGEGMIRTMKKTQLLTLIAILVLAACASVYATAPAYQLTLVNPMPAETGYIWTTGMGGSENCYIGPVTLEVRKLDSSTGLYDFAGYQRTLCVDVLGTIYSGCTWYADSATGVPNSVLGGDEASRTASWDRIVSMAENNPGWATDSGPGAFDAIQNAGIQTAVWEMLRDGSNFDLGSGNFQLGSTSAGSSIATSAQGFFAGSSNYTPGCSSDTIYYKATNWDANGNKISSQYGQDQLFFVVEPHHPNKDVPEFPAAMLCPLGLATLAMIKRRFAK